MRQTSEKRPLTSARVMEALHREHLPVNSVMRLIQQRTHRRHLRVFEDRIPPHFFVLEPVAHPLAVLLTHHGRDVVGKMA
jgi:hypothetical protein